MQDGGEGVSELFSAILNPSGPNFEEWNQVLGSHRVPLESPELKRATLGEEVDVEVYMVNLKCLTLRQRAKLMYVIATKAQVPVYQVEAEIFRMGLPIRAADVIVSFNMRAFV
jgi:hypothetical protein